MFLDVSELKFDKNGKHFCNLKYAVFIKPQCTIITDIDYSFYLCMEKNEFKLFSLFLLGHNKTEKYNFVGMREPMHFLQFQSEEELIL